MENKKHYVSKEELQQALIDYKTQCDLAVAQGLPEPRVPEYIGECFVKIATHISYRPNFYNYTFRDEMVSDGIENCLMYFRNYNPEKFNNPFGYFSKIIWYAFLRRIAKEKRELAKKFKYIESLDITDLLTQEQDTGEFVNQFLEYLKNELDHVDPSLREIKQRVKKVKSSDDIIDFSDILEETYDEVVPDNKE
jgi:hypothetical protein